LGGTRSLAISLSLALDPGVVKIADIVDKPVDELLIACGASGITQPPEKQKADGFSAVGFLDVAPIFAGRVTRKS
jgi:hypothetical protein